MEHPMSTQVLPDITDVLSTTQIRHLLRVPYTRLYGWWRRGGGPQRRGRALTEGTAWSATLEDIDTWLSKCWIGEPADRFNVWELFPYRTLLSLTDMAQANRMTITNFKALIRMVRSPLAYLVNRTYLFDPRDAMAWASVVAQIKLSLGYGIDSKWEDTVL